MEHNPRPTTRIEAFTDAAFAFALTMLVISFDQLPTSVVDLVQSMKAIPAFVASGALLMLFWHHHSQWSQRYCLCDTKTVVLTSLFVFTVMVFVYPLRLMFSSFMHWISGGWLRASFSAASASELVTLFAIYGIGFSLMCGIMILLYRHALQKSEDLQLNALDRFDAQSGVLTFVFMGSTGILSLLMCALLPTRWALLSPFSYSLLAIIMPWYGLRRGKQREALMTTPRESENR
jgi:uncharacterized membrane protein